MNLDISRGHPSGVEKMFLESYDKFSDELFRFCLIRVRDRELAYDLVQESFSKTWLYLSEGKEITHPRAFLYRVANNLIVDHSRRKKDASLEGMMEDTGYEPEDEYSKDPGTQHDIRFALKLLDQLEEIYREVIVMRYLNELSPREIASALGISENVVSVRIHRALERLKKLAIDTQNTQKPA